MRFLQFVAGMGIDVADADQLRARAPVALRIERNDSEHVHAIRDRLGVQHSRRQTVEVAASKLAIMRSENRARFW